MNILFIILAVTAAFAMGAFTVAAGCAGIIGIAVVSASVGTPSSAYQPIDNKAKCEREYTEAQVAAARGEEPHSHRLLFDQYVERHGDTIPHETSKDTLTALRNTRVVASADMWGNAIRLYNKHDSCMKATAVVAEG